MISVEVALALPDEQVVMALSLPVGSTAAQALALSGLAERFPAVFQQPWQQDIFSKVTADNTRQVLQDGDRVEVYRPLQIDPKAARQQRAIAARNKAGQ